MDTCRKNLKEFSIYEPLNFQGFVLKFIKSKEEKPVKFNTSMEKEIFEQPTVIQNLIKDYIDTEFDFKMAEFLLSFTE